VWLGVACGFCTLAFGTSRAVPLISSEKNLSWAVGSFLSLKKKNNNLKKSALSKCSSPHHSQSLEQENGVPQFSSAFLLAVAQLALKETK